MTTGFPAALRYRQAVPHSGKVHLRPEPAKNSNQFGADI